MNEHKAFLGDGEKTFALTSTMIHELERKTDAGIGGLCMRFADGNFRYLELSETIRCALIGGGTDPEEAANLIETYVANQPLDKSRLLVIEILEVLYFGKPNEE